MRRGYVWKCKLKERVEGDTMETRMWIEMRIEPARAKAVTTAYDA